MIDDVRSRLDSIERRQALLRQELAGLDETLADLKMSLHSVATPEPLQVVATPPASVPPTPPALPPDPVPAQPVPPPLPVQALTVGAPPVDKTAPPAPVSKSSLEMRVGTVWLARIGIVILLTGLVFLANYAWKSLVEHFGTIAKLGVLYLSGGALCAIGLVIERKRESLRSYAQVLLAGGMASIYYTTYAAHYVPSLKVIGSPLLAGLLLVAIAGIIGWMADRRNSQVTAGLAILLAFYASAVNPIAYFTLASNAILAVAAVVLMSRKRWMAVPFLALAAAYWSYLYWRLAGNWRFLDAHVPGGTDLAIQLSFLSVYWIIFTAGAFLPTGSKASGAVRAVFSTLNDAAFFCLAMIALSHDHRDSLWIVALVFGALQLGLSLAARRVHGPGSELASSWLAKALFFLTLAILIRFTGSSLAIILAVESSLLVFAARQLPSRVLAAAGPLAGILAALAGIVSLTNSGSPSAAGLVAFLLMGNAWFCCRPPALSLSSFALALSGAGLGCAVLVKQLPDAWEPSGPAFLGLVLLAGITFHKSRELAFSGLLAGAGSALLQFAIMDSAGFWPSLTALGLLAASAVTGPLVAGGDKFIRVPGEILAIAATLLFWQWVCGYFPESQRFWLLGLVAVASLALSREKPLRQAVAAILSIAAFLIYLDHGIGSNARYIPWDFFGCLLLLVQERLARNARAPVALARFAGIAGLFALLNWVTATVRFHHDPLPLTAAWALLALAVFFAGFLLRSRIFRLGGLGILALALCRIGLLDVWKLDLPFRILSFLVLGSVLLLLGYLYNRYADRIRKWL